MAVAACFCFAFDEINGFKTIWKRSNPEFDKSISSADKTEIFLEEDANKSINVSEKSLSAFERSIQQRAIPAGLIVPRDGRDVVHFRLGALTGMSAVAEDKTLSSLTQQSLAAMCIVETPIENEALVPLWSHAGWLRGVLEKYLRSGCDISVLHHFWNDCKDGLRKNTKVPSADIILGRYAQRQRYGRIVDESHYINQNDLEDGREILSMPLSNPVMMVIPFLDEFGPLIFSLYRASLLASRILFYAQGKMERCCKYASLLSKIQKLPSRVTGYPCEQCSKPHRSVVLHEYSSSIVEVHPAKRSLLSVISDDVPFMRYEEGDWPEFHWIACTSDLSIAQQQNLFDIRIDISAGDGISTGQPTVIQSGTNLKLQASPRDHRSYQNLYWALRHLDNFHGTKYFNSPPPGTGPADAEAMAINIRNRPGIEAEWQSDINMLLSWTDFKESSKPYPSFTTTQEDEYTRVTMDAQDRGALEVRILQYFSHITERIFKHLGSLVAAAEARDTNSGRAKVFVYKHDMVKLGVDPENETDKEWVKKMLDFYFERETCMK